VAYTILNGSLAVILKWTGSLTSARPARYIRVSTRDKGQNTENQLTQLRAFAAFTIKDVTMDWCVAEVSSSILGSRGAV
jgi:hypothetical protein